MKQFLTTLMVATMLMLACKKENKTVPALTTIEATNITANSVTTGGNITDDGGSAIAKSGIVWATHTAPTVSDSSTNDGTGAGSFNSTINGLNANTTYYLRAYAINASGTGYGNEISVKTSTGLATVVTAAISDIQPLSAVSGGNITNDGGATITERGVVYATTANPTINNFKVTAGSGTGIFTATLQPLASEQTYYVRAFATNSMGTAYGNEIQFSAASANTVTDIDGNVYTYITVCDKSWTTANLKTTKYKNGDLITNGLSGFDWNTATTGAYTFPNGQAANKDTFGLYYNLYAINDSRGVCPSGWHVPTDDDWKNIEMCQGMSQFDAGEEGLRGTVGGKFLEGGSSGLNINKGGYLLNPDGKYTKFGQNGAYWSSTIVGTSGEGNWLRIFSLSGPDEIYRTYNSGWTMSTRCVKD